MHQDPQPSHLTPSTFDSLQLVRLGKAAVVATIVAQRAEAQRERCVSHVDVLSLGLQQAQARLQDAEKATIERELLIQRLRSEDVEMRDCLATTEFKLSSTEARVSDLTTLVSRLREELEQSNQAQMVMSDDAASAGARLLDIARQLEEAKSDRNSLALQITHLEQDLQSARNDLGEAESRYSTLQAQQLATMSSNEVTRTLRRQIEELEQRVHRRTEQIGVHQHDIKRLETNLRLQDERLTELTGELEVAQAEKTAMIEDCRTTREARDEALRKCEQLEERIEELEERLAATTAARDVELATMVGVTLDTCARRRQVSRAFAETLASRNARLQQLARRAEEAEQSSVDSKAAAEQQCEAYRATVVELQHSRAMIDQSQAECEAAAKASTQATVALATVFCDAMRVMTTSNVVSERHTVLQADLVEIKKQFKLNLSEFNALRSKHEAVLRREDEEKLHTQTLRKRCDELQLSLETVQNEHDSAIKELSRCQEELRVHISDSTERLAEESGLREQLETEQRRYESAVDSLRSDLARTTAELEDAQLHRANLVSTHRQALDDLTTAKEELEKSLVDALEELERSRDAQNELKVLEDRHSAEIEALRDDLESARFDLASITAARDHLLAEQISVTKELDGRKEDACNALQAKEDLEKELQELRLEHAAELKAIEAQLEDVVQRRSSAEHALRDLESRHEETLQQRDELKNNLSKAQTALESLKVDITALTDRQARDSDEHAAELKILSAKQQEMEAARSEAQSRLDDMQDRLKALETELANTKSERDDAQTQATSLQADLQRSLSLQRSHESRIYEW